MSGVMQHRTPTAKLTYKVNKESESAMVPVANQKASQTFAIHCICKPRAKKGGTSISVSHKDS
jgi:hypothetical protein